MNSLDKLLSPELANNIKQKILTNPNKLQQEILQYLLTRSANTLFAKEHRFHNIKDYNSFKENIPIREYDDFNYYWDLIYKNNIDILAPGKPVYLLRTSASTGTPKYIPATYESLQNFLLGFLKPLMQYCYDNKIKLDYLSNYKNISLTGTSNLSNYHGYPVGTISGVLRSLQPEELLKNSLPSKKILNLMDTKGWDKMFKELAKEAMDSKVAFCTGLPSWIAQFFNACCSISNNSNLSDMLPDLKLLITSGVNYRPYLPQFQQLFNHKISIREVYAASEGFFAYQDLDNSSGSEQEGDMLLDVSAGIYYEFLSTIDNSRVNLSEVKTGVPYILIISTLAGLWAYKMGDIIEFTSINPYRIKILGRVKHYISIQAEHVYSNNVEYAIKEVNNDLKIDINNFTVAPNKLGSADIPYHEWYIETPQYHGLNLDNLAVKLDQALCKNSTSYNYGRKRKSLAMPKVFLVKPGAFLQYLEQKNTSSLQLKVPKVLNNRDIAEFLFINNLILEKAMMV